MHTPLGGMVMNRVSIAQPDITLKLDLDGVIRGASLSDAIPGEVLEGWVGRPWADTVGSVGGDRVRSMVQDARAAGVSGFHQFTQRFPSGLELPMEFTTVRLGGQAGLLAVGKNLQAVAEMQSRLIAAQQAREQDYWKLREIETRSRLLFDASSEAVVMVLADSLRVVEAGDTGCPGILDHVADPIAADRADRVGPGTADPIFQRLARDGIGQGRAADDAVEVELQRDVGLGNRDAAHVRTMHWISPAGGRAREAVATSPMGWVILVPADRPEGGSCRRP
jgi:transcriptional regulator PpsR